MLHESDAMEGIDPFILTRDGVFLVNRSDVGEDLYSSVGMVSIGDTNNGSK